MMPSSQPPQINTITVKKEEPPKTEEEQHKSLIDRLAAAFRSNNLQEEEEEKTTLPPTIKPRSNRNSFSNSTTPSLRKRSSGSINSYRDNNESSSTTSSTRKRDSNGINYNNFVSAVNEYQQQQQQQKQTPLANISTSPPLFSFKSNSSNENNIHHSPIKLKSPSTTKLPATTITASSSSSVQSTTPSSPKSTSNNSNNKGRVAKRLSATLSSMMISSPSISTNPHSNNQNAAAVAALLQVIKEIQPIEPMDLGTLLDQGQEPLLIDMRPLEHYEKSRIRHSINVNLPSLLLKRYRRGVVSNFNLESFITTPEGVDYYRKWMKTFHAQNIQNLPSGEEEQEQEHKVRLIVYDDHMNDNNNQDTTAAVWTLIGVIAKNLQNPENVSWLKDGFKAFEALDLTNKYMTGISHFTSPLPNSTLVKKSQAANAFAAAANGAPKLKMPTPMISRSATTLSTKSFNHRHHPSTSTNMNDGSGVNVQRRASLFSLDTTALRINKSTSSRLAYGKHQRNNSSSTNHIATEKDLSSIHEKMFSPSTPATNLSSPDVFHTPFESMPPSAATIVPPKEYIQEEDEEEEEELEEMEEEEGEDMVTPKTEGEFDFVISEIIPHFLYLGPEIATVDQLGGLKSRSIKRILNMAEECDDDVPGLKENFQYKKIAARDTVEMQNVEGTLRKAVGVIGKKRNCGNNYYTYFTDEFVYNR